MKLRDATVDDCGFIASLFDNEEYEKYFSENETTEEEWRERFPLFAEEENKIILENDSPVGWFTYKIVGSACEIGIIVLKREMIGRGIGYAAFNSVLVSLPNSVKTVSLDVQKRNTHAVSFYKRYGFQIVGEEKQSIGDGEEIYHKMKLCRNIL